MRHGSSLLAAIAAATLAGPALAQVVLPDGRPNPAYDGLYAWFQADDGPRAGKFPAVDGSPVNNWLDSSDNGRDLVRVSADAARIPVYAEDAAGNGMPSVEFDGDDFIWANQVDEFGEISTGRTIFIVARMDVINSGYLFDSCTTAGRNAMFGGWSQAPENWTVYTGIDIIDCGPVVTEELVGISMTLENGAQSIIINDGEPITASLDIQNLPGFLLGNRYNVVNGMIGGIYEVLVFDEVLTAADLDAIDAYLDDKYGGGGNACFGDLNDDGTVNGADFGVMLAEWGPCADCGGDLNMDGEVSGADVGLLLSVWGECPGDPCDGVDCDDMDPCTIDYCDPLTGECVHEPIDGCGDGGCGDPLSGNCNEANGTPGCSDAACCEAVCTVDSFCCDVEWDEACVTIAASQGDC